MLPTDICTCLQQRKQLKAVRQLQDCQQTGRAKG